MQDFLRFLAAKIFKPPPNPIPDDVIEAALQKTILDVRVWIPEIKKQEVVYRIQRNQNELPVFLFRLGREINLSTHDEDWISTIHGIMRECCACEVFFSNDIKKGFCMIHGEGTVIGPRNRIGENFTIYQGCTIGLKKDHDPGCVIGSNVTLFTNSQIIGPVTIGDNVVIGAQSVVLTDIPSNSICYGIPARIHKTLRDFNGDHY